MSDRKPEPVEVLRRWEASGAVWEVLGEAGDEITVALLTCDAGEEMGRVRSADPALRDYVGDRTAIRREDVVAVVGVIPRQDRWQWFDLVAERKFDRARAALPILLDGSETGVGLVIGLGSQFLRLGICAAGGRRALENALPRHQSWLARRIEGQARGWSPADLARAIEDLRRADWLLKSTPLGDLRIMEELLLRLQHGREAAA